MTDDSALGTDEDIERRLDLMPSELWESLWEAVDAMASVPEISKVVQRGPIPRKAVRGGTRKAVLGGKQFRPRVAPRGEQIDTNRVDGGKKVSGNVAEGVEQPTFGMPYLVYCDEVKMVERLLYDADLIVPFDWPGWEARFWYGQHVADLNSAPVSDAVRVLTAVMRQERFVDGTIGVAIESGLLPAAFARIRRWCGENRRPTQGSP